MEAIIADYWKDVLSCPTVTRDDDFFDLGGDSYAAMALAGMARDGDILLPVEEIYKNSVLKDMALAASYLPHGQLPAEKGYSTEKELTPAFKQEIKVLCNISEEHIDDVYPCTPLQGVWMTARADLLEHQSAKAYWMPPCIDVQLFQSSWDRVAEVYPILRTRIVEASTGIYQVVTDETITWTTHHSLQDYLATDKEVSMTLGDRLQRFCIVDDLANGHRYFVLSAHHATYDGWTLRILFAQAWRIYSGEPIRKIRMSFKSFSQTVASIDRESAQLYWQALLSGYPRDSLVEPLFRGHSLAHDTDVARSVVLTHARRFGAATSTILQVCFAQALSIVLGSSDIVVRILRSGRAGSSPDVADVGGPTLCIVVVRLFVLPERAFRDLVKEMDAQIDAARPYEQLAIDGVGKDLCDLDAVPQLLVDSRDERHSEGSPFGMRAVASYNIVRMPLIFAAEYGDDCSELRAVFDSRMVSNERVSMLMDEWERAIQSLSWELVEAN